MGNSGNVLICIAGNFIFLLLLSHHFSEYFIFLNFNFTKKMPRKRKQHMVKVCTSEDILGNIQSSSKRDIWCSQTKTIIFQLQNSSHQNQEIYGVKTQDFFIPICGKLCEDCCFEKESKNHKKSKGKKRKNSSTQNMAEDNNENLEENSSKK